MFIHAPVPYAKGDSMAPEGHENIESRIDKVHEDEDAVEGLRGESWSSG